MMGARSLGTIVLKCFGLYLLLAGLSGLSGALQSLGMSGESVGLQEPRELFLWLAVPALLYLALGLLLLFSTEAVIRVFFRDLEASAEPPSTPFAFQAVGFSLLGAWLLSTALPALVSRLLMILFLAEASRRQELLQWWSANWAESVQVLAEVLVGIALFAWSRRLASLWFKLQPIREALDRDERPAS